MINELFNNDDLTKIVKKEHIADSNIAAKEVKPDTSNTMLDTCNEARKTNTDYIKIPEGAPINIKLSPDEIDDLTATFDVYDTDVYDAIKTQSYSSGVDPTKDSFTEEEFLSIIADGNQALMHAGALITLSNQYCDTYEVIGVNHDGTVNTVDIMAHTQVGDQQFSAYSQEYSSFNIRTWINDIYFNAFSSNIRNAAKTMNVVTNTDSGNTTTNDKVKLLSMTEIGATHTYAPTEEGSLYTGVFTPNLWNTATPDRWRAAGTYGNANYYWLRSRHTSYTGAVWYVGSGGNCYVGNFAGTRGVLPVLRF